MKKFLFIILLFSCSNKVKDQYNKYFSKKEKINESKKIIIKKNNEEIEKIEILDKDILEIKEFSDIDGSHILSVKYIKSQLNDGEIIKVLDTRHVKKLNSVIRVTTEYQWSNPFGKKIRMRFIADFSRKENKMTQIIFHDDI